VVLDNPAPTLDVRECVTAHPTELSACAFSRAEGEADSGAATQRVALADAPNVAVMDMADYLCPEDKCPAVIGNVLIYRGGSHLTATYVETLAPQFARALRRAMGKN
jgi:hypothetical protein